jgi:predicted DNA binding CopG/RHH family protein
MSAKKSKIPTFQTDQEERAFWSKHSVEEFGGDLEDLDVEIRPTRTEQIALRLSKEDLKALRALAKKRGVGHTTLARSILEQWLEKIRDKHVA